MGKLHDTLNQFGTALELPEEFKNSLLSAYDEDFSGADAKVTELEQANAEKEAQLIAQKTEFDSQLNAAKAANWELLRAGGNAGSESQTSFTEDDGSNPDITIEDLFK